MSYKYKIKPNNSRKFQLILQDFPADSLNKKIIQDLKIIHIEINTKNDTWEILFQGYEALSEDIKIELEEYLAKQFEITKVYIYQQVANLKDVLDNNWQNIISAIKGKYPHLKNALAKLLVDVVEGKINISIPKSAFENFDEIEIFEVDLKAIISNSLPMNANIILSIKEDTIPKEDILKDIQLKALQNRKLNPAKETKIDIDNSKKIYRKKETKPLFNDDLIANNITKTNDINGEINNIFVLGTVANVDFRTFSTGNHLLSFDFADDTNGIICKLFLNKNNEEPEEIIKKLKSSYKVLLHGIVKYDSFLNDYILQPKQIKLIKEEVRLDNAKVKRVELHAHTKMSNMDAVVEPKDLINRAVMWGWDSIAITDHGVVQAFPKAMEAKEKLKKAGKDIKIIYGVEGYVTGENPKQPRANHIIILAKNLTGLHNLYRLISISHLKYFYKSRPRLPRHIIEEYREGLIIGSACEAGEIIRAIVNREDEEKILELAKFYDYLEIQPIGNNAFLKRSSNFPYIKTDEDLININLKVAEIAKKLNKPLVATCDVHFLNKEDSVFRAILMHGKGFSDANFQPPLYLRTTEEMLEEFKYLGEDLAYEVVVTNSRKIASMIEEIQPIPDEDKLYSPSIKGASEEIKNMAYKKAQALYGSPLPNLVKDRLDMELNSIIGHGFAVLYLIAHKLVGKSLQDGYLVGSRGSVGSSLVATLTDITEVNPLPPHYRCPNCKYNEFINDGSFNCGYDMADKDCPKCNTKLIKDGHDVPFAVFMGFDGDKVPDIDLNFSGEYQPIVHKYTEVLFGKNNVFRAGTISSVAEKTAFQYIKNFFTHHNGTKRNAYINSFIKGCMDVKRTTGQHPGGIMVVPRDMDIHHFTPVQRPADDKDADTITTHFDYHSISSRLVKLDLLGHDDPTMIKMLENLTGLNAREIPFDDEKTMSIFSSTEALGLTKEELGSTSGTFGIPEFRTPFTRKMLEDTKPKQFSDLVRISGFSHGTDVWLNNAQDLILQGICTVSESISCRDDIMMYLIHRGMDPLFSFKIMEKVRKGKGLSEDDEQKMLAANIPNWYIDSCKKIKYLFPRAHAIAYVMMAFRIAYCKVHYPLAFYAAYFSIRAQEFDAEIIAQGKDKVKKTLDELSHPDKVLSVKDKAFQIILELAFEMYLRGFTLQKVQLNKSLADKFQIEGNSLIPSFTALAGVSLAAANNIVKAREEGEIISISDLRKRANLSTPMVEALRNHGCLDDLPEDDQLSLF